ncbi:MAG: type IV pilus twitching motility protein PilT, partial [Planctomycetota bacterium]
MAKIDTLFKEMLGHGGSDLHLSQGQPPKIRRHGRIIPLQHPVLTYDQLSEMFKEICPPDRWRHYKKTGDLDFAYSFADNTARFRGNLFIQLHGIGGVFRQIPARIQTIDELQLPPVLKTFAWIRQGLVLVTGPTGSGKSTTLAGILDFVNTNYARHILTIEEPIEFIHTDKRSVYCQREVGLDVNSFSDGLQASTRQDTDIILVGEMRTAQEIGLAISAAAKGSLVFATLHTNSAVKTIDRIIDAFPAEEQGQVRSMLADVLRG